jgi:4'-phosphopantetheinyl transferase
MTANRVQKDLLIVRTADTGWPDAGSLPGPVGDLEEGAIRIWSAAYCDLDPQYDRFSAILSGDEQKKASQFRKPGDKRRWILRHGYLRQVLGSCTGSDPSRLPLVSGDYGKPGFEPGSEFSGVSFSISHTKDIVALAMVKKYEIGLDIVKPDERYPFRDTAEYLFRPEERKAIEEERPDLQYRHFFRIWALKEAVLKAAGGTAMLMRDVDISAIIQRPFVDDWYVLRTCKGEQEFFIHESDGCHGYHYAVAVCRNR